MAPRNALNKPGRRRGIYSKLAEREAAKLLSCAWVLDERSSFAAARARCVFAICRDADISGSAKAVLAACIGHMNHWAQFSCFAAMPTIAEEVGVSVSTCWQAISAAEGKYIVTRRGKRFRTHGYTATEITIHPRFGSSNDKENFGANSVASLNGTAPNTANYVANFEQLTTNSRKTTSEKSEHNPLILTHFKEPSSESEKIGIREDDEFPKHLEKRKRGTRDEIFIRRSSKVWTELETRRGERLFTEGSCGGKGRWVDVVELTKTLGVEG